MADAPVVSTWVHVRAADPLDGVALRLIGAFAGLPLKVKVSVVEVAEL